MEDRIYPMPQVAFVFLLFIAAVVLPAEPERAEGEWRAMQPMPDERTEVSVATDGERIYVLGGFRQAGERSSVAPREMHVYDPAGDAWSSPGEIPQGVNHAGLVHLDGRLYIVGGYHENTFDATDAVHVY